MSSAGITRACVRYLTSAVFPISCCERKSRIEWEPSSGALRVAEKQLESTVRAAAHQKAWFAQLRAEVFENQKPYAIVQADMPLELFHAMDVPVVSNQWWAAIISAKRLSPVYLDAMNARGFHEGLCRY